TVLHWGSKHGSEKIIRMFAGKYKADVNARTNGGYAPLHLAAQFGRHDVYELLVGVFEADSHIRDFSGKKPEQYRNVKMQSRPKISSHNLKGRKNKYGDKDLGFLRIGSLNVRVKKTTEAFSSFLGVGGGGSIDPIAEKMHKGWGSADNLGQDMPAPKGLGGSKRKSKRPLQQSGTHSNPGTPNQQQRIIQRHSLQDSDSDTAAGFDQNWQN
ncbi:PREDICTED: uncharacterized protein LOC108558383, partial [Nicrophorus vespilloides]|uniref:Uncharacterized protein LOC108558383 n=1 Tax=Nicrophorus vespilloides TaxID=110193 RepID=A0ABM1M873_NICVS